MEYFLAVSDKQLGLCLRLLYAEGIRAIVETVRNSKGKIEFHIKANTDEALLRDLIERYNICLLYTSEKGLAMAIVKYLGGDHYYKQIIKKWTSHFEEVEDA